MNAPNTLRPVQSSVPGQGNKLVSIIKTGWIVSAEKQIQLFRFNSSDPRAYAEFLTNMADVGRVGNSWDFEARAIGLRVIKLGNTAPTADEVHAMKKYLASLEIAVKVGSDKKPAAELSGLQFIDPQEFSVSAGSGATLSSTVNPSSQKGEINLPVPVLIQRGWEIYGEVKTTLASVPQALRNSGEEYAVEIFLVGFKQTY